MLLRRYSLVGVLVLGGMVWFANTNYRTLSEPDEGRYAEIPREMLASGDWVTPRLNAIPYLEKPPLQYWATALAYAGFGFDPWVSRLAPTMLGLLGIVVAHLLGRTLWGPRAGQLAALILASCPLYFVVAHINTLDIGLAFFVNAALACFIVAQRAPPGSPAERNWMWLCWAALAAGFLQKGLVALALPGFALVVYSALYRDFQLWSRLHLVAGSVIVAVLTLPWLVLVSRRNPDFPSFFFLHEHLTRFTTTEHRRAEPGWYFIAVLLVGVFPWIVPMARASIDRARAVEGGPASQGERLLLVWACSVVVFFSLSGSKLAPYIVPAVMPLALLTGRWLQTNVTPRTLRSVAIPAVVFAVLLVCSGPIVRFLMKPGIRRTAYLEIADWGLMAGVIVAIGAAIGLGLVRRNQHGAAAAVAIGFTMSLTVLLCGSNSIELVRGRKQLDTVIAPHLGPETGFYCVGMYWQTLPFLLRRTCTVVAYRGELGLQFDPHGEHWIEDVLEFVPRWNDRADAVAVVNPKFLEQLQAAGIQARIVLRESNVLVMVRR